MGWRSTRTVLTLFSLFQVTQAPFEVSLNQSLYIQVDVNGPVHDLVLALDTCVASPSPDDFYHRAYYLVRNG